MIPAFSANMSQIMGSTWGLCIHTSLQLSQDEGYLHFHQALSHLQNCREQWWQETRLQLIMSPTFLEMGVVDCKNFVSVNWIYLAGCELDPSQPSANYKKISVHIIFFVYFLSFYMYIRYIKRDGTLTVEIQKKKRGLSELSEH